MIRNCIWAVVLAVSLTACQTTHPNYGKGYVTPSQGVMANFDGYLARDDASYFAISTDGRYAGISYCPAGPFGCEENSGDIAIRACERRSKGVPCKIYADGRKIVWQGLRNTGKTETPVEVQTGSGHISLSHAVRMSFADYLETENPIFFAVSKDGTESGYSYCNGTPCSHGDGGLKEKAVSLCEARSRYSKRCFIYASGRDVVWK